MDEDYCTGKRSFEEVPPEKWDDIFKKLFGSSEEVIYVERVRVDPLLRFMKDPKNVDWLSALVRKGG